MAEPGSEVDAGQRWQMIIAAAYFIAERREHTHWAMSWRYHSGGWGLRRRRESRNSE